MKLKRLKRLGKEKEGARTITKTLERLKRGAAGTCANPDKRSYRVTLIITLTDKALGGEDKSKGPLSAHPPAVKAE